MTEQERTQLIAETCRLCDSDQIRARGLCSRHYQSEARAGRLHMHPKAEIVRVVMAVNGRCPADHGHSVSHTCYNTHGCRCRRCRNAKARRRLAYDWEARRRAGQDVWVPAAGTVRRLRALAVQGWAVSVIATETGLFPRSLGKVREGSRERVHLSTYAAVADTYERLAMHRNNTREGRITRTRALAHGWVPPLAWDDIDRDRRPKGLAA